MVVGSFGSWRFVVRVERSFSTITALNRAYDVKEKRPIWRAKILSLAITIGAAVFIIVSTGALLAGPDVAEKLFSQWGLGHPFAIIWKWARWLVIFSAMMAMLALIYYFLPNIEQKFRLISPGAIAAVLLSLLATWLFNLYVAHFGSYGVMYGGLGSVVILMMWLYILCSIVVIGGEINALFDKISFRRRHTAKETQQGKNADRFRD